MGKKLTSKEKNEQTIDVAEAMYKFAEKMSKKPHKHWYVGLDKDNKPVLFDEEIGLPLQRAVQTTVENIKKTIAMELEKIIEIRSQGIWYDTDETTGEKTIETGCSVIPTREVIKLQEKLMGKSAHSKTAFIGKGEK